MAEPVRVLIVDDDVDYRALLRWQLDKHESCDVVVDAADGHEALEQLSVQDVEVAVVDLMMPGMDGFEVIERILADHPDVVPVAYSAMANDRARQQLGGIGVEMLTKSSDPDPLVATIQRLAAEQRGQADGRQTPADA